MSTSPRWIRFQGRTYHLESGERALDAMLRQGAPVTFSCRKGTCRSCMLQAHSGDPGDAARAPLGPELAALGFFLPCCADYPVEVEASLPDLSLCTHEAVLAERIELAPSLFRLRLELVRSLDWKPGQRVGLMADKGAVRSYSIVSQMSDYFLEVDVRTYPDDAFSTYLTLGLAIGETVRFQGPDGDFTARDDLAQRDIVKVPQRDACSMRSV